MILKRKEFWIALVDLVVGLALYFGAKYLAPRIFDDVKFVIALAQPFILIIIGMLALDEVVRKIRGY
jgi:uncharacterized membrane protein YhaH (DUF805 family)